MEIRLAKPDETARIKEIWNYCFTDTQDFVEWYFDKKYSPENTIAALDDNIILSNLQMLPYHIFFHGHKLDTSYIVGAATMPEARGKSSMKLLLSHALQHMKEKGQLITILLPFNYGFYKKYGWETCYYQKVYSLQMSDIKNLIATYGKMRPFNQQIDLQTLIQVYGAFTECKNGFIVRSEADWSCILKDHAMEGGRVYILEDEEGAPEGYIFYSISQKTFAVHEMTYTGPDAFRGLLGFVYAHSAQADKLIWKAPWDDMSFLSLADPQGEVTLKPFVMARVVDVQAVLNLLCNDIDEEVDFSIGIHDTFAHWNNGVYRIKNAQVATSAEQNADISCMINTFTQLAMGFLSPNQAVAAGLLKTNTAQAIIQAEKLFKPMTNYINDYY